MTTSRDEFIKVLMWSVSAADDYRLKGGKLVEATYSNQLINDKLAQIPYGLDLLSGIHSYTQSSLDNYFSLRMLTLPQGPPVLGSSGNIDFNLTISGCSTLLRQFLEGAVYANWLLEVENSREVTERGFAFYWANLTERLKYERALESPKIDFYSNLKNEAIASGTSLDLLNFWEDGKKCEPKIKIDDATGKLREIEFNISFPDELIRLLGSGFKNGSWLYHWLSGLTHGLSWAHFDNSQMESEVELVERNPDLMRFAHAALFGMQLFQEIFPKLDHSFENKLCSPSFTVS